MLLTDGVKFIAVFLISNFLPGLVLVGAIMIACVAWEGCGEKVVAAAKKLGNKIRIWRKKLWR